MKVFLPDEVSGDRLPYWPRQTYTSRLVDLALVVGYSALALLILGIIVVVGPAH